MSATPAVADEVKTPAKTGGHGKKDPARRSRKSQHEAELAATTEASGEADGKSSSLKVSKGGKKTKAAKAPRKAEYVGDRPVYTKAISNFLYDNSIFESSVAIDGAMAEIKKAKALDEVFVIPMTHKILNMDGCLRFALFLQISSVDLPEGEAPFPKDCKFSAGPALKRIDECFDDGTADAVWAHVEAAEDAESGSESD